VRRSGVQRRAARNGRTSNGNQALNFGRDHRPKITARIFRFMDMSIVFVMTVFVVGLTSIGYILEEPGTAPTKKNNVKSKG
jgi:hypothetical protein